MQLNDQTRRRFNRSINHRTQKASERLTVNKTIRMWPFPCSSSPPPCYHHQQVSVSLPRVYKSSYQVAMIGIFARFHFWDCFRFVCDPLNKNISLYFRSHAIIEKSTLEIKQSSGNLQAFFFRGLSRSGPWMCVRRHNGVRFGSHDLDWWSRKWKRFFSWFAFGWWPEFYVTRSFDGLGWIEKLL